MLISKLAALFIDDIFDMSGLLWMGLWSVPSSLVSVVSFCDDDDGGHHINKDQVIAFRSLNSFIMAKECPQVLLGQYGTAKPAKNPALPKLDLRNDLNPLSCVSLHPCSLHTLPDRNS